MKKLTAGIFSVLMGLVAVNAADAAVASKGYVEGQIKGVKDYVDTGLDKKQNNLTVTGGVLTWDAETSTLGLTGIATSDNLETLQNTVNTLNGDVNTDGSVKKQIASAIADEVLRSDAYADKAEEDAIASAKSYTDGAISDMQVKSNMMSAKPENWGSMSQQDQQAWLEGHYASIKYVDTEIATVSGNASQLAQTVSGLSTDVGNLQDDIDDINNETTGILAQAKSYADDQDAAQTQTITNAYVAADAALKTELEGKINQASSGASGAVEALAQTVASNKSAAEAAIALKADQTALDGLSQTVTTNAQTAAAAAKAADDKAVAAQNTADTALANAATAQGEVDALETVVANNKSATDDALATKIPQPGNECSNPANYCVLTFGTNGYFWEVIERAEDEQLVQDEPAA